MFGVDVGTGAAGCRRGVLCCGSTIPKSGPVVQWGGIYPEETFWRRSFLKVESALVFQAQIPYNEKKPENPFFVYLLETAQFSQTKGIVFVDISHETGDRIRYYRKKKQMTIDQLAEAICKSKSCVSKYENGQIAVDLPTLYDIAAALEVRVTQLLYLPPDRTAGTPSGTVPAFFAGLERFYCYYYDGRCNSILRSVCDILEQAEPGSFHVHMYMNVDDYSHYHLCENVYDGRLTHFDTLSLLVMQNQHMEMDHYQVGIPSPFMNAPVKWGLAFGISSRPLMPTSTKVLFAKSPQKETPEFEKSLRLSREDIRLMKLYNMLTIL